MQKRLLFQVGIWSFIVYWIFGCSSRMAGDLRLSLKNYDAAIANYEKAVSEHPENWKIRKKLGYAYYKAGHMDKAADELKKVLEKKPDDSDANYYLGLIRIRNGERRKAIQNWKAFHKPDKPLVQKKLRQQVTLLEIYDGLQFAKEALAREERLQTLPPQQNSVAVFYYKDMSPEGEFRYLQKALASMIITDLSKVKALKVVERLRIQYLLEEMKLGATGIVDKQTSPRAGRLLGAENLIVGTLESGSILTKTGVASAIRKVVVAAFSLSKDQGDFFELQKMIVFNILRVLNINLTPIEKQNVGLYHTKSFKAVLCYGQALEAQDRGRWKEARRYYRKALAEDPSFLLAIWGHDGCPDSSSPGIDQLNSMTPEEIGAVAEKAMNVAESRQNQADRASARAEDTGGSEGRGSKGKGSVSVSW